MKKHLIYGIFFLLLLFLTTGCVRQTIIGGWKSLDEKDEFYYIFNNDKTCFYQMAVAQLDCTYEDDGEKLDILFKGNEKAITYWYHFEKGVLVIRDVNGKDNKFVKIN